MGTFVVLTLMIFSQLISDDRGLTWLAVFNDVYQGADVVKLALALMNLILDQLDLDLIWHRIILAGFHHHCPLHLSRTKLRLSHPAFTTKADCTFSLWFAPLAGTIFILSIKLYSEKKT